MKTDQFVDQLDSQFLELIAFINRHGFRVGVVGGTVRDYFLGHHASDFKDYDCELRPIDSKQDLISSFNTLKSSLSDKYKTEKLAFGILRIKEKNFECEISLPRIETFTDEFHHSNFTASFVADLDYKKGFNRRDFTINAIMIEIFGEQHNLIDPLNGVQDLKKKVLNPCSDDFYKDPVRFLRALRFSLKLGDFSINSTIKSRFKKLKFSDFSSHYLKSEMKKSGKELKFVSSLFHFLSEPFLDMRMNIEGVDQLDIITSCMTLSIDQRKKLKEIFDLQQINVTLKPLPWSFKNKQVDKELVDQFKWLKSVSEKEFSIYRKNYWIDIDYHDYNSLCGIDINLDHIAPKERALYQLEFRLKEYFDN